MGRFTQMLDAMTNAINGRATPVPAIPPGSGDFGHSQEQFAPVEYGKYIATSNDVYSAAMLRARSLAKLSLNYYDQPNGAGELIPGGGEVGALLQHVNPHWTWRRMIVQYELSMAIWGQSYWFTERATPMSAPSELWWANPTRVRPVLDRTDYIKRFDYTPPGSNQPIQFDPQEVVWFRYPNIIDEFSGLSPMAAVRLAADVASSSLKANQSLFDQGFIQAGMIGPPADSDFTKPQAEDLEATLNNRFRGGDKAHRWAVMRYDFQTKEIGVTPRDAMFIEQMNLTFRQVCRGMGVPPALLADSEYATLSNLTVYERQLWDGLMEFEANFMTDELNEQLLPMFDGSGMGGVKSTSFDFSNIAALQEDKTTKETRDQAQIADGRVTINEWREENGRDPVPWGDVYWAPFSVVPVSDDDSGADPDPDGGEATVSRATQRESMFVGEEQALADVLRAWFASVFDATQQKLRQKRDIEGAANQPFDVLRYIVKLRTSARPVITATIKKAVGLAGVQAGVEVGEDLLSNPALVKQAEELVTKLADTVANQVADELRSTLAEGIAKNNTIDQMTDRVRDIVGPDAAEWRARRVAQTETTRAVTDGKQETWRMIGVDGKRWVTQGDGAVRDTHAAAAGQVVGLEQDFYVGACAGPGPGRMGCVEEDVNCRCDMQPAKIKGRVVPSGSNGQATRSSLLVIRDKLATMQEVT